MTEIHREVTASGDAPAGAKETSEIVEIIADARTKPAVGAAGGCQSEVFAADAQVVPSTANADDGTIDVVWYSGAMVPRIDRSTGCLLYTSRCV